jgi:ABC-2 type transport system permease protein
MNWPVWSRVWEIVRKEFRVVFRDPRLRTVLLMPPIVQSIIFGFAVNMDVEHARIGWHDMDGSAQSRALLASLEGSRNFVVVRHLYQEEEVSDALDRAEADLVLTVLPGFGQAIVRGEPGRVRLLLDGSNSNTASIVSEYTRRALQRYSATLQQQQQGQRIMARTQGAGPPVALQLPEVRAVTRVWFNENLISRNYFVPGVIVNIIALVTLMLTALAIVREKEIGTMEQLIVTPIQPLELMLGKTLPFALVGMFHITMLTILARVIFSVPFRGSLLVLYGSSVLFLLTTLGAGLFISTIVRTQQQAMMATFFFFFPVLLLSGFAFPIDSMPLVVQWVTYLNPVRYFMEILRGLFLKGLGVMELWPQLAAMGVLGIGIILLSANRFHKRLD